MATWGVITTEDEKNKAIIVETLLKLPYKVRRKVLDEVIFVIMTIEGMTIVVDVELLSKKELFPKEKKGETCYAILKQSLILLNFKGYKSKSWKMDTIAHEIAHFTIGHHSIKVKRVRRGNVHERNADDLSEKWGFKRCYKDYNF